MTDALLDSSSTRVLPPELDRRYPVIVKGDRCASPAAITSSAASPPAGA